MAENSRLKYSATTRDGATVHDSRSRGPSIQGSVVNRTNRSPSYNRQPMYTFSPLDRMSPQEHSTPDLSTVRKTLVQKSDQHRLVQSQIRSPRQHSEKSPLRNSTESFASHTKKEGIIDKLREMGRGLQYLMDRTNSHSEDLQQRLHYLKSIMEEVFIDVSNEIEDLKIQNSELRRHNSAMDEREMQKMEERFNRKIDQLEREKAELQGAMRQMSVNMEKGREAQEELGRKTRDIDKLNKVIDNLESEKARNAADLERMNDKLQDINNQKKQAQQQLSSQHQILDGMKQEAQSAIEDNKKLDKRVRDCENTINNLEDRISDLQRKNKELTAQINSANEEKGRVSQRAKQDLDELMHLKEVNKEVEAKLVECVNKLREAARGKEGYQTQIKQLRQAVDGERRKSDGIKFEFEGRMKDQRDKFGKKIGEYENRIDQADKRWRDLQKKSDLNEEEMKLLRGQLDGQRRKSLAMEKNFQDLNQEKKGLLSRLDQEKDNYRRQSGQLKDALGKLQKSHGLLKEFARQSDIYQSELKNMKSEIDKERRKSLAMEEDANRKIKALIDQNSGLSRKMEEDQEKYGRVMNNLKDYESKYRDFEKKYQDESRKSEAYNAKIGEILGELEKERRLSSMNIREKQEVIKVLEDKNNKLADKIQKDADEFKRRQSDFFNKNKDLERILAETARKSDVMAQELLALKDEYEKERRKSFMYEERMKELSEKFANVAAKLEDTSDKYYQKEKFCKAMEDKYKEIEKLFLEQTRKSQLNEEEIRMLHDEIEKERRKSSALEQDAGNKIRGLVDKNTQLSQRLNENKEKQEKHMAMMREFEERAKDYEGKYRDMARKSDMYEGEIVKLRDQVDKDRRKSLQLDEEHKMKVRALEEKNLQILQKLEEDREKLGRATTDLKDKQAKYKLIEKLLDDQRRASMMNVEQIKRLGIEMEKQRRRSLASEEENKRRIEALAAEKRRIAEQAEDLRQRLSESSKTVDSLQTKASRAERQAGQLAHVLDKIAKEKEKAEQMARSFKDEAAERERLVKKEREERDKALRDLKASRDELNNCMNDMTKLANTIRHLEGELEKKSADLNESANNNRYLAEVLNDMKAAQVKLNARIQQLRKINIENAELFEKNYSVLKNEIEYRNENLEDKEKRIGLLEKQVVSDSKKVIAILPNGSRDRSITPNPERRR